MKKLVLMAALLGLLCALPSAATAGDTGIIKLSLWDDIAIAAPNNIHNITGLDLGIGSKADTVDGVQLDLIYSNTYKTRGVKSAFIYNTADIVYGLQGGLITINKQDMRGIQGGLVSISEGDLTGLHDGYVNIAKGEVVGVQAGLVNWNTGSLTGVQLGLVNYVNHIKGLQIGLINIAKNGWLPAMVIVNGRF
ncbi:MAG: hypothetical protein IKN49_06185 [Elusimicrobiaceae bacterium]|nr:hypothetical protein [Elusimicrobiaceae bacterium]